MGEHGDGTRYDIGGQVLVFPTTASSETSPFDGGKQRRARCNFSFSPVPVSPSALDESSHESSVAIRLPSRQKKIPRFDFNEISTSVRPRSEYRKSGSVLENERKNRNGERVSRRLFTVASTPLAIESVYRIRRTGQIAIS